MKEKKTYVPPKVACTVVLMEESIAAGSATINTGWDDPYNENTPKEREWESGWSTGRDYDI